MSASSSAIGILKDDANTLQSKKGGEEDGMRGEERDGGIRGILRIGFTIFEKNTLPRGRRGAICGQKQMFSYSHFLQNM